MIRKSTVLESEGLYPQTKKPDPSLRNLALGILLQALRDVVSPKKSLNKEWNFWRKDALEWFHSDKPHPGSLLWVCEILEVSPKNLRDWLRHYQRSGYNRRKEISKKLVRFQILH